MLGPRLAHPVLPPLARLFNAAHEVVLALHLDLEEQLELVVVGALGLLVKVLAGLDGGHDGLEVLAVVYEEGDYAARAGHDLGELVEGECHFGAVVVFEGDGEGAEGVGVEAAAVEDGLQLGFEVDVDGDVGGC